MDKADKKNNSFEGELSFEQRKKDHIYWSLSKESQADQSPSSIIKLSHDPLPEIDFKDVSLESKSKLFPESKPFLISSMTGGHDESESLNKKLVKIALKNNWLFSTGSLRREIEDKDLKNSEWANIRAEFKEVKLIGNIGLPQIVDPLLRKKLVNLMHELKFDGLFVHLNPLQEVLQTEGTPNYKNGLESLARLKEDLSIPLLLKETGTGFSKSSLRKIKNSKLRINALDVSGFGGTHWGRIEGLRNSKDSLFYKAAKTYKDWGHSTVESLLSLREEKLDTEVWASGGLRSGLDAAISFAFGADVAGFAMPFMDAAVSQNSDQALQDLIDQIEYETKIALFCTGSRSILDLKEKCSSEGGWSWMR